MQLSKSVCVYLPSSLMHGLFFPLTPLPPGIWFNAITGRVWRDIARSAYFQHWVCSRVSHSIARGKPAFIDHLEVTGVEFGAIPPLFSNVRWIPASSHTEQGELDPQADYNVSVAADVTFRSGIKFTVQAKVWINKVRRLMLDLVNTYIRVYICKKIYMYTCIHIRHTPSSHQGKPPIPPLARRRWPCSST